MSKICGHFLWLEDYHFIVCNVSDLVMQTMSQQEKERKAEELRRTQDNLARGIDHASENTIVFNALPFIDAHGVY